MKKNSTYRAWPMFLVLLLPAMLVGIAAFVLGVPKRKSWYASDPPAAHGSPSTVEAKTPPTEDTRGDPNKPQGADAGGDQPPP